MSMNFSTAEELEANKNKISKERIRKLTQDRQNPQDVKKPNASVKAEGLREVKPHGNGKRNQYIIIDDEVFDPKRIRTLADIEAFIEEDY